MRVNLQDRTNRLYYTGTHCLPGSSERAINFSSVREAAKVALGERMTGMEIVVHYEVVGCEVHLPVLAEWCE